MLQKLQRTSQKQSTDKTSQTPTTRSGNVGVSRLRNEITFNNRFGKLTSKSNQGWLQKFCIYMIVFSVVIAVCSTIWIFVTIMMKSENNSEIKPKLVNDHFIKTLPKIIKWDELKIVDKNNLDKIDNVANETESLDSNISSFFVTFRLYDTPNCVEDSNANFITITREASLQNEKTKNANEECSSCFSYCENKFENGVALEHHNVKAIKIIDGNGELDLYSDCNFNSYHASIILSDGIFTDGCIHLFDWPPTRGIKVVPDSLLTLQSQPPSIEKESLPPLQSHVKRISTSENVPSYRVIYSCESSEYFGYQTQANYYGFLTSGQHPNARFSRILTSSEIDDIATYVPTYTYKRDPYSRRYGPLNKADGLKKWMESIQAPDEEIMVVIDPDNWILQDISHWVQKVKKGHAIGEAAWFHGNPLVTRLWREVCKQNCDRDLDLVGVPYMLHRDDLEAIAPLWKEYILLMKEREELDHEFLNRYASIQMGWGTEMFGYIFAAAHAGIKHEVVHGIQIRDVSGRPKNQEEERSYDMIHMGRAWFPPSYEKGKQWWHTEGKEFSGFGAQVWCKCNYTASDIIPWPIPDGTDFQSRHTLYLLHESRQYFGEIPKTKFRQQGEHGYHNPYP